MANIKVYLDTCVYNRPFDDQRQLIVELETRAKIFIQNLIINGKLDLVVSYMSVYENKECSDAVKSDVIGRFFSYGKICI